MFICSLRCTSVLSLMNVKQKAFEILRSSVKVLQKKCSSVIKCSSVYFVPYYVTMKTYVTTNRFLSLHCEKSVKILCRYLLSLSNDILYTWKKKFLSNACQMIIHYSLMTTNHSPFLISSMHGGDIRNIFWHWNRSLSEWLIRLKNNS